MSPLHRRDESQGSRMPYVLGVDIGSTRVKAAVCELGSDPTPVAVALEGNTPWMPAVLRVGADDTLEVGTAALHTARLEPQRIARGFLERVGDPIPFVLGHSCYSAEVLTASLIAWLADVLSDAEGTPP